MANIYGKLMKIQTQIKAPKNMYNSFGKYKYRNAEGILEALKPYLADNNVSLIMSDDIELVGEKYFLKSTATLVDCETAETVSNHAYAELDPSHKGMSADQITGCCSSYCRKYTLNAMFLLDDTKDADSDEYQEQTENTKATNTMPKVTNTMPKATEQKNATVIPNCEKCGGKVVAMPCDAGEMSADDVYAFSLKKYEKCYCGKCIKLMFNENKENKDDKA